MIQYASKVERIFHELDTKGNGKITSEELKVWCMAAPAAGITNDDQVTELLKKMGADQNGSIGYYEFLAAVLWLPRKESIPPKLFEKAFKAFDKDKDGVISVEDFNHALNGSRQTWKSRLCSNNEAELISIFKDADKDLDEKIKFEEF